MNCQEAQSNVLNYINHKLEKEQTKAFIEHIRECEDCMDELEIYYTMVVGLRQLDNGEVLTTDFQKELGDDIDQRYEMLQKEKERNYLLRILIVLFLLFGTFWVVAQSIVSLL